MLIFVVLYRGQRRKTNMLCSMCNKNTAVIFINKQMPDNSIETEGLCYECAKKRGINPLEALTKQANI